jgi:hypothetical protein
LPVQTGQTLAVEFTTRNPTTGGRQYADSLPTATLVIADVDNAATVAVAQKGTTGVYSASVTLPTISAGQAVQIRATATVAGVTDSDDVWEDTGTFILGPGNGIAQVNHDTGGTDNWRITETGTGNPIPGATITCYYTTVYQSGTIGPHDVLGQTTTDADGRWAASIGIVPPPSGTLNYTLVVQNPGKDQATTVTFTVDSTGTVTTP